MLCTVIVLVFSSHHGHTTTHQVPQATRTNMSMHEATLYSYEAQNTYSAVGTTVRIACHATPVVNDTTVAARK